MNVDSIQTEPYQDGNVDGKYWQVVRTNDMSAFDNLPTNIRSWMKVNFSHLPAEDVLYDFIYKFKHDEDACLRALIADNNIIAKHDNVQVSA